MTYKARHDLLLVEEVEETEKGVIIHIPSNARLSNFIKLKVIAVGPRVEDIKEGDIVIAEKMLQSMDPISKFFLIREEYVHLIENGQ